jgi:hypothetical protein
VGVHGVQAWPSLMILQKDSGDEGRLSRHYNI